MTPKSQIQNLKSEKLRWLQRFPLTLKMMLITTMAGLVVWAVLDYLQTNRIKRIFIAQLAEKLAEQAEEDRLRFDYYVKTFHQTLRIFIRLKNLSGYIEKQEWAGEDDMPVKYYKKLPPPWFPARAMLRHFAKPRFALLLDSQAKVREVYHGQQDAPPPSLLKLSPILLAKTHGQSYITTFDGSPYLVASESLSDSNSDSKSEVQATLVFASPVDEELLNAAIGVRPDHIVALLAPGENPVVLVSNNSEEIPAGTPLETVKEKYLVTSKVFFDYGSSDLEISHASLISKKEVKALTDAIILRDRQRHAISAAGFILSFLIIMFAITRDIRRLTQRISDFAYSILGMPRGKLGKGDELYILEERFKHLTKEVLESRETIKRQAEEKTHLIVNNAFDAIITVNDGGIITTWNPQSETIFGWSCEEAIGQSITDTIIPMQYFEAHMKGFKHFLAVGKGPMFNSQVETIARHRDGHEFPVELSVSPAKSEGKSIFIFIIRDITERKRAEELIYASLEEKEILLREIHHRVKNNMQVISSLLSLQSRQMSDKKGMEVLKESRNRIKSMALIHERLYQSKDLAHLNFYDYVSDLVRGLYRSHGADIEKIALKIDVDDVLLRLDSAIPCGLIINELISNSLKYAFPNGKEGEIKITLCKINEKEMELKVSDNGVGIPEGLDFRNTESLGLRLVTTLAENQLQGKIELHREKETEFQIRFIETRMEEENG